MLKEGVHVGVISEEGTALCVLKVYGDKSHNLRIVSQSYSSGDLMQIVLHCPHVKPLYSFLKQHFEGESSADNGEILDPRD
jgi:hypothetical protein